MNINSGRAGEIPARNLWRLVMTVTPLRQQMPETSELPPIAETDANGSATKQRSTRGRSTIDFPYADLDDAVSVARTIHDKGGVPLEKDQLAAAMGQPVTSGAFLAKLYATRMFGLIEIVSGKSKLTDLGFEVIEGETNRARAAKIKAFLNVPLFAKAYGEFRNKPLPPRPGGLEKAFVGFGVLETRGGNARWAFDRSAKQAGFFEHGDDRLVEPIVAGWLPPSSAQKAVEIEPEASVKIMSDLTPPSTAAEEFLIRGLLARMPAPNTDWSLTERVRWLRALSVNLAMLYGTSDEAEIQIAVPKPALELLPTRAQVASRPRAPEPEPQKVEPKWEPKAGGDLDDDIPF